MPRQKETAQPTLAPTVLLAGHKVCSKCNFEKPFSEFAKQKKNKSGIDSRCGECARLAAAEYRKVNLEKARESSRRSTAKNPERRKQTLAAWLSENRERSRAIKRNWRNSNLEKARAIEAESRKSTRDTTLARKRSYAKNNRPKYAHYSNLRRARLLQATPAWVDLAAIERIYWECSVMNDLTGETHHVDHIVPLINDSVCGLHVPWNLQIILERENRSKGNKFFVRAHTPTGGAPSIREPAAERTQTISLRSVTGSLL